MASWKVSCHHIFETTAGNGLDMFALDDFIGREQTERIRNVLMKVRMYAIK